MSVEDFARRWMASPHWGGWRVGMICSFTQQVVIPGTPVESGQVARWSIGGLAAPDGAVPTPDLTHPGTRAFLLEDVRAAWGGEGCEYPRPELEVIEDGHGDARVSVFVSHLKERNYYGGYCDSLAEALIEALEAAP